MKYDNLVKLIVGGKFNILYNIATPNEIINAFYNLYENYSYLSIKTTHAQLLINNIPNVLGLNTKNIFFNYKDNTIWYNTDDISDLDVAYKYWAYSSYITVMGINFYNYVDNIGYVQKNLDNLMYSSKNDLCINILESVYLVRDAIQTIMSKINYQKICDGIRIFNVNVAYSPHDDGYLINGKNISSKFKYGLTLKLCLEIANEVISVNKNLLK